MKNEIRRSSLLSNRAKRFVSFSVLAAGLSLTSCAKEDTSHPSQPPTVTISSAAPAPSQLELPVDSSAEPQGTVIHAGGEFNPLTYRQGRHQLKENDSIWRLEYPYETAGIRPGYMEYKIGKIDSQGIEIIMNFEVFNSEHSSNRDSPWKIKYGEEKSLPQDYQNSKDPAWVMMLVKAERGPSGTAFVTITYPDSKSR